MIVNTILVDEMLREIQPHGTADFPVQVYLDDLAEYDIGYVRWHWHPEIELAFVTQGAVEYHVNETRILLEPGDGIFINSEMLHSANAARGSSAVMYSVVFDAAILARGSSRNYGKFVRPVLRNGNLRFLKLSRQVGWQCRATGCMEEIVRYENGREFAYELGMMNCLGGFWHILLQNCGELAADSAKQPELHDLRMKQMLSFLHANYGNPITLSDIAQAASISKSECQRCFIKTLHVSPVGYLLGYRLEKAAALLRNSVLPVSDIALRCGFNGLSYFGKRFRETYGKSPREYRAEGAEEAWEGCEGENANFGNGAADFAAAVAGYGGKADRNERKL